MVLERLRGRRRIWDACALAMTSGKSDAFSSPSDVTIRCIRGSRTFPGIFGVLGDLCSLDWNRWHQNEFGKKHGLINSHCLPEVWSETSSWTLHGELRWCDCIQAWLPYLSLVSRILQFFQFRIFSARFFGIWIFLFEFEQPDIPNLEFLDQIWFLHWKKFIFQNWVFIMSLICFHIFQVWCEHSNTWPPHHYAA